MKSEKRRRKIVFIDYSAGGQTGSAREMERERRGERRGHFCRCSGNVGSGPFAAATTKSVGAVALEGI